MVCDDLNLPAPDVGGTSLEIVVHEGNIVDGNRAAEE